MIRILGDRCFLSSSNSSGLFSLSSHIQLKLHLQTGAVALGACAQAAGVWSNPGRLKVTAAEEWHTFLFLLTAKCAETLKTGRISLLPETLLCVHNCLEKRKTGACLQACLGWMLLRCGLRSSQPLLLFPSPPFVRARCFFYSHSFLPSVNTASPCKVALQSPGELCRERDRLRSRSDAQVN